MPRETATRLRWAQADLAPTWVPSGLAFTGQESVSLPAVLNNSKTILQLRVYYAACFDCSRATNIRCWFRAALGASGAEPDVRLRQPGQSSVVCSYIAMRCNAHGLASPNLMSGFHAVCFTLGTGGGNLDRCYIDGAEVSYSAQGSSYGVQSFRKSVRLDPRSIAPFTASGFNGTYYRFATWPFELTPAQIAAVSQIGESRDCFARRGETPASPPRRIRSLLWSRLAYLWAGACCTCIAERGRRILR